MNPQQKKLNSGNHMSDPSKVNQNIKTKQKKNSSLIKWINIIGSDDIRAQDSPTRRTYKPLSGYPEFTPSFRSIYDEPSTAAERITGSGYRYMPVHRETYGYSPRAIYAHHYGRPSKF